MSETKTVLVIDDDHEFVADIRKLLTSSGCHVATAENGRDGLHEAKRLRPDLILLDVMMTERTEGFFALQELRRIPALTATPVIVMCSIYRNQPLFRVSPEAGWLPADLFVPKPVAPARLVEEVHRLMNGSRGVAAGNGDL